MKIRYSSKFMFFPVSVVLLACGGNSSIEQDAKIIADLHCRSQLLMEKASNGNSQLLQESASLSTRALELTQQFERKYSDEDRRKFNEAITEQLKECE
jgi:hypothetical protein